jgi:LuxR family transcriptional regulator, maltose regulon positive regulatory protein
MVTTAAVGNMRVLQRRRIIQRPRLHALLDESTARVRALIAPAGYGKSTLAEQWVARPGCRSAWYTARHSSVDVAALALGLARATSGIVEGCEVRLREHLRAVGTAASNVSVLAEILGEDLEEWPGDAWLVLDDYQELAGALEAESFVADLIALCPLQLLLTSRQRPSWVSAKSILYGDVLEINQTALAMDNQEAAEVLADWSGASATGLVALANGWPAVIGLASVSSAEIDSDDIVPESLYRFFAEEVFDALGDEVHVGLTELATAPMIDGELASALLGHDRAESICTAALDVGVLVERDGRLELHPLARSFLDERNVAAPARDTIDTCLAYYKARRDWDAAFEVASRHRGADELESLLNESLDDLLDTARLSTLESWCEFAAQSEIDGPVFSLARAETALRQGRHAQAQAHAEAAASDGTLAFRALSVAGRAAHLASREEDALELYRRAEAVAETDTMRRDAAWGQVICAVELDLAETSEMLGRVSAEVDASDPREFIRATTCTLSFEVRSGKVDLADGDRAWELLPVIDDPLIATGFESIYASGLALAARYKDALEVATALLASARRYRLDFALPYGLVSAGLAHAGRRNWSAAHRYLDEADTVTRESRNLYAELFAFAARLRTLGQQGLHVKALALPVPSLRSAPAIRTEVLASRALVLAAADRLREAESALHELRASPTVESIVLREAVEVVIQLKQGGRLDPQRLARFEEHAFETGALDLLVTAYRTVPELLVLLFRSARPSDRLVDLVRRAGDDDLVRTLGLSVAENDRRQLLTRREREVFDLLRQGLSNRQIADVLVVSESTAKLHVQHVFNKLGIHSRQALAIQAALERSNHATAAEGGDSGSDL